MKRIIILLFAVASVFPAYSQTYQTYLQEGNSCFDNGDYACAEAKYNEAFRLASGQDKQVAEIKITRTKWCDDHLKAANKAFANKNYEMAKENYQSVIDSNPKDAHATSQLEKCDNILNSPATTSSASKNKTGRTDAKQTGKTTLTTSTQNVSFNARGGIITIDVKTTASDYTITHLPLWCQMAGKSSGEFTLNCEANNTGQIRANWFEVRAGGETVKIYVDQEAKENVDVDVDVDVDVETTLTTSKQNVSFSASGGVKLIEIETNASDYRITSVPSWCQVVSRYSSGIFTLNCNANSTEQARSGWVEVNAGGKTVAILVKQAKMRTSECFNCPKTNDPWGLTLGYAGYSGYSQETFEDVSLNGLQLGLRFEPLFKYGLGLHTGLLIEAYAKNSDLNDDSDDYYYPEFEMSAVNIPLHFEYRWNLSKWFNVFAYGGVGLNAMITYEFDDYALTATSEYGGGFRISHVQFNIGRSSHLSDIKNIEYFDGLKTIPKVTFSISYMF